MPSVDLEPLQVAVAVLVREPAFTEAARRLRAELVRSREPFVWVTLDLDMLGTPLPAAIKSGWIFALRKDVPSGEHFHPNSTQHMVVISGRGESCVGGVRGRMGPCGPGARATDAWFVIPPRVAHEFVPEGEDMLVVSFHTCAAEELEEVSCAAGESRLYDGPPRSR
jgi:hypothetical protein